MAATATVGNGSMIALAAASRAQVDAFHAAALAHGGCSEGAPGLRPQSGPDFYAADVRDTCATPTATSSPPCAVTHRRGRQACGQVRTTCWRDTRAFMRGCASALLSNKASITSPAPSSSAPPTCTP